MTLRLWLKTNILACIFLAQIFKARGYNSVKETLSKFWSHCRNPPSGSFSLHSLVPLPKLLKCANIFESKSTLLTKTPSALLQSAHKAIYNTVWISRTTIYIHLRVLENEIYYSEQLVVRGTDAGRPDLLLKRGECWALEADPQPDRPCGVTGAGWVRCSQWNGLCLFQGKQTQFLIRILMACR